MHRKTLIILNVVVALFGALPALAAAKPGKPFRYSPARGHDCRNGYKRVKHGRKVYCMRRVAGGHADPATPAPVGTQPPSPTAPAAEESPGPTTATVSLTASRDPSAPLDVVYTYSVAATESGRPIATPPGYLTLTSDGLLECAINVGEANPSGGECTVTYEGPATHTVTVTYVSRVQATETFVEPIN